jgi:hypothetical protein
MKLVSFKMASRTGKILTNPNGSRAASGAVVNETTLEALLKSHSVSAKSGKAISSHVAKHRDALKRLADR